MPVATASYSGHVLASASDDEYKVVEGNVYFPPQALKDSSLFKVTTTHTTCPWKGEANYYELNIDGKKIKDVAWYYPDTITPKAEPIKNFVAFYKSKIDVKVE